MSRSLLSFFKPEPEAGEEVVRMDVEEPPPLVLVAAGAVVVEGEEDGPARRSFARALARLLQYDMGNSHTN